MARERYPIAGPMPATMTVDFRRERRRIIPPGPDVDPDAPVDFEEREVAVCRVRGPWVCRLCGAANTSWTDVDIPAPAGRPEIARYTDARCPDCGTRTELEIRIDLADDTATVNVVNPPATVTAAANAMPPLTRAPRNEYIDIRRAVEVTFPAHPAVIHYRHAMIGVTPDGRAAPLGLMPGMRYIGTARANGNTDPWRGDEEPAITVAVGAIMLHMPNVADGIMPGPDAPAAMTPLFAPSDNPSEITTVPNATGHTLTPPGLHRVGMYIRWDQSRAIHTILLLPDGGTPNGNRAIAESMFMHYENMTPADVAASLVHENPE